MSCLYARALSVVA